MNIKFDGLVSSNGFAIHQNRRSKEIDMAMSPMLFICLFFAGFGVFLIGCSTIWWVSLQARLINDKGSS